jgi:hypothetical protein
VKAPRLLALALVAVVTGCSGEGPQLEPICTTDDECPSAQLCFAEGCGDPGKNIVVEVEGGALNGQFARDFALEAGKLGAVSNFSIGSPLTVSGEFQRERSFSSNPLDRTSYTESVVLRAVGQSVLLPGVMRIYEERFASPERGAFQMKVGAGTFTVTAMPGDRTVPPVVNSIELPSNSPSLTFVFPAVDGAPALTGQLIKKIDATLLPPEPVLLSSSTAVDLQLFDAQTSEPLSQRFPVAATSGEFAITISPEARNRSRLMILAAPREPGAPIPTKRFVLDSQISAAVSLEYGEFGESAEIEGTIVDSQGAPIAGAQVVLEGTVVGDGTFRSKIVQTNPAGEFKVISLGSKSDGSFQLTVVPPKGSRAAYSQRNVTVKVTRMPGTNATATLSPKIFTLDDRLIARGVVNQPGSDKPAAGVFVRATLQVATRTTLEELKALPIEPAESITGEDGTFELPLDPGIWRFEYMPGGLLPISSRLVTLKAAVDDRTGVKATTQTLTPVSLSFGRTVTGNVTGEVLGANGTMVQAVPYSQLRFFRVTTVEGRPASILLGTAIADDRGKYQVVLPTVEMTDAKASSNP